jgi:putative Holliday junction resolvase
MKRYLGIDFGEKRFGLALGDSESKIATPLSIIAASQVELLRIIKEEEIDELVIGLPLTLRSETGLMAARSSSFVRGLAEASGLPVIEIDERLSSKAADSLLGRRDNTRRDAVAAMVILQHYLDSL